MTKRELVIVTGANRGIGKAIALKFAKENYNVIIFGREKKSLKNVQDEFKSYGIICESFAGDVSDEKFVSESIHKILNEFGTIDHLINNAGVGIMKKVVDASLEDFKKQIDANLYGIFNFSKSVLPNMIQKQSGSIINILSLASKNAFVGGALYSASKHAALGFTKSLMLEVREFNIRVAAICPGSVDTDFSDRVIQSKNKEKILQPNDIAETVFSIIKLPVRAMISEIDIRPTNPK